MTDATTIEAPSLAAPGIAHGFFTREGGVSQGVYASLNGGLGSRDAPHHVQENRRRMAARLGVAAERFLTPYLIHSAQAQIVREPWREADRPRCDALVTDAPGLALSVTGADCGVILFHDAERRVIGAAHAGWKGALGGVLEATLEAMEALGASRARIKAALGPTIARSSYEVGPEFMERFLSEDPASASLFSTGAEGGRAHFDLPGFIGYRLTRAGVGAFEDLALDTYADDRRFYSYRRSQHRGEPDYGRLVAAIVLKES